MYGYFDDAENVYLLLEICYDGHLLRILKERERGRLPEKEAREIVKQICTGLEYIHRQKVLHRDIKPENIIIH
jgi:serine/threonine protein kinase